MSSQTDNSLSDNPMPVARLASGDSLRVALEGMRHRPLRAVLSGLGIALGIAALVAVVGLSASSKEEISRQLDSLGTNLLSVSGGSTLGGDTAELPQDAVEMVLRIGPVQTAAALGSTEARIYRNDRIEDAESGGIGVRAATESLRETIGFGLLAGRWLDPAVGEFPVTVLGVEAAQRLGISPQLVEESSPQVWLGDRWFTVIGILEQSALAPELDRSALVGWTAAETYLDFDGHPTTIYERSTEESVTDVQAVLPATVSPAAPDEVQVSRPSDALAAKAATDAAFTGLLLGLGAVSLLVGGVGVANTMVVSVLERRQEIGLRRALGATRKMIRDQFLGEAVALSVIGGAAGAVIGVIVTVVFAVISSWPIAIPLWSIAAGLGVTVLVGIVAGIFPSSRAARLAPTEALSI